MSDTKPATRYRRIENGLYEHNRPNVQAIIFKSPRWSLWAWAVYWRGEAKCSVAHSLEQARREAEPWIQSAPGEAR